MKMDDYEDEHHINNDTPHEKEYKVSSFLYWKLKHGVYLKPTLRDRIIFNRLAPKFMCEIYKIRSIEFYMRVFDQIEVIFQSDDIKKMLSYTVLSNIIKKICRHFNNEPCDLPHRFYFKYIEIREKYKKYKDKELNKFYKKQIEKLNNFTNQDDIIKSCNELKMIFIDVADTILNIGKRLENYDKSNNIKFSFYNDQYLEYNKYYNDSWDDEHLNYFDPEFIHYKNNSK